MPLKCTKSRPASWAFSVNHSDGAGGIEGAEDRHATRHTHETRNEKRRPNEKRETRNSGFTVSRSPYGVRFPLIVLRFRDASSYSVSEDGRRAFLPRTPRT